MASPPNEPFPAFACLSKRRHAMKFFLDLIFAVLMLLIAMA